MSTPNDFASASQALAAALLAASVDPADAIRLLTSFADFSVTSEAGASPVTVARQKMDAAAAALFRRSAVIALCRAVASYQPASYDDATATRTAVCALLDREITAAGDAGEDATYSALRALRVAVANDLTARGADLVPIATFSGLMPSLALAQRLYRDPARADELVTHANPRHPAFMPATFRALAS